MRRREFCLWLSAVTAMDLLSAKAQKPGKPVIGCLALGSFQDGRKTFDWVRRGLAETGFIEGRDFDVELRVADYQAERLRELAADLVARNVAIIVALTTPSTAAAQAIGSDRVFHGSRSRRQRFRQQSQPSRRKRHGHFHARSNPGHEAA